LIRVSSDNNTTLVPETAQAAIRLPYTEPKVISSLEPPHDDLSTGVTPTPSSAELLGSEAETIVRPAIAEPTEPNGSTAFKPFVKNQSSDACGSNLSDGAPPVLMTGDPSLVRLPCTEPKVMNKPKPVLSSNHRSCLPFLSDFKFSRMARERQLAS